MCGLRKSLIVLILATVLLAAGCAAELEATAVPPTRTLAPTMTQTATAVIPKPTLTPTATKTPIKTVLPTPTLSATETSTPIPPVTPLPGQVYELEGASPDLEIVNQIGGAVTAVAVRDNLAYVGIGSRLAVVDVSDPWHPVVVSWSGILPGLAEQIVLRDDLAFVALGKAGLWIFDVSDLTGFQPVGHVYLANPIRQFLLEESVIFAMDTTGRPLDTD